MRRLEESIVTYLFLLQVVRQIRHHDLHLRRHTIFRWTTLTLLARRTRWLRWVNGHSSLSIRCSRQSLISGLGKGKDLSWNIRGGRLCRCRSVGGLLSFLVLENISFCVRFMFFKRAYATSTTSATSSAATATSTTTNRVAPFSSLPVCAFVGGRCGSSSCGRSLLRLAS